MSVDRYLRLIAGFFVALSVAMGYWVHPAWFLFTAFVGLNLFQSAFTDWSFPGRGLIRIRYWQSGNLGREAALSRLSSCRVSKLPNCHFECECP